MYNKILFDKICNVECSFEELKQFNGKIDEQEYDLDNPFEKYYNVDRIVLAIEKYKRKDMEYRCLACWANAYNWIISGGCKLKYEESLKALLIYEIRDWLDRLSFFEGSEDTFDIEEYKTTFKSLDRVYNDIEDCNAICHNYGYDEDDYAILLIINDKSKYYTKMLSDFGYNLDSQVEFDYLKKQSKKLKKKGYTELKTAYVFDDEYKL